MAPKSKGTKVNLRDLQRELQPKDALPIAPRPAEEREEERERKWSRYEKEAGSGSGRWADRDVDGDSDGEWRRDSKPPKKEEVEVDFRGARGAKFQTGPPVDEDAGFASLRRGPASASASGTNGGSREGRKEREEEDVDFSSIRSQARKPQRPKSPQGEEAVDFSAARSGGPKRDVRGVAPRGEEPPVDFSSARSGGLRRTATGSLQQPEEAVVDFASARSGGPKKGIREDSDVGFSNIRSSNKQQPQKIEPDRERARGLRDVVAAVFAGEAPPPSKRESPAEPNAVPEAPAAAPATEAPKEDASPAAQASPEAGAEDPSSSSSTQESTVEEVVTEQPKQKEQQEAAAKESPASTPQKAQQSTSPSSAGSGGEGTTAEPAAAATPAVAAAGEPVEKFVPRWKRQQSDAEPTAPKPSVREEPVVLEPIKLSSLRGTGGGAAAAGISKMAGGDKYVPPCLRKDGTGTGQKASPLQQQQSGSGSSAVRKLLSNATAAREAAAAAEAAEKKKQEQAEARRQQLLERQRQQEDEQQKLQHAFRCSNDEAMHAFVARAQEMLDKGTTPASEEIEACVSLLPEADKGSLAAPVCLIGLVFRAGFAAKDGQEVRKKAQPLVPLTKKLLNDAREEIPRASTLIIQQLVVLANELRCPRLSADTSLIEAVFDFLLLENFIPQKDFVAWLEDVDDETPGRTTVMFQIASWGLWLRGELGPTQEASESEEDNDDDIEALVPKRNFVKISRRLR